MQRARRLWGKVRDYVTHDLHEIILPSSLPNPPGYVPPPKIPISTYIKVSGKVVRTYLDSWNKEKLRQMLREQHGEDPFDKELQATKQELRGLAEEFGEAARGGATALKPFLQNLWNTRAVAYRDAVKQFIAGYKEGFQEANKPDIPPEVAQEMQRQQQEEQQDAAQLATSSAEPVEVAPSAGPEAVAGLGAQQPEQRPEQASQQQTRSS